MTTLLHLDASARSGRSDRQLHGSHTRRLSHRFVEQWLQQRPGDRVLVRDVGLQPPSPVSGPGYMRRLPLPRNANHGWRRHWLKATP
ncbi:MAG: hypothetical protein WBD81_03695 [Collimonas pratensis]|uniref:hypothetical protein n=1 Tax=Collimonas pratensis TaxID=279113 RepID=UPI003C739772